MRAKLSFLAALALVLVFAGSARAQSSLQTSSAKTVAFSFYKTAQATPNFERWVKNTDPFMSMPLAKRDRLLPREEARMKAEFSEFNPQADLLVMKTSVKIDLNYPRDPENDPLILEYEYKNSKKDEAEFFAFTYGSDNFAVVVNGMDEKQTVELPLNRYRVLHDRIGGGHDAWAVLQLRPLQADIQNPYVINDMEHWLLATEIASLTLWNKTGQLIYEYTAPWYISPVFTDLDTLKKAPPAEEDSDTLP